MQDVFIKINENIGTLKDETKIQSWIFQIARNTIFDYYRLSSKEKAINGQLEINEMDDKLSETMDEAIGDMIAMLDKLPREHCEAICAIEINGISIQEYAQNTGITYTAAKTRVHRSKKELKSLLLSCCQYEFDKYGTVVDIAPIKRQ